MRSLTFKLTLAFLLVGLTGAALVALIIRERTRSAFDTFLVDREQQNLIDNLLGYYQTRGSWQGVAEIFQFSTVNSPGIIPGNPPAPINGGRDFRRDWLKVTLVGTDNRVVLSANPNQMGQMVSGKDLAQAIPLSLNNQTIGWIMPARQPHTLDPNSPEGAFPGKYQPCYRAQRYCGSFPGAFFKWFAGIYHDALVARADRGDHRYRPRQARPAGQGAVPG